MHECYIIDSCAYNANPSPCEDSTVGWFFNSDTEQCQFGGCEGRGNLFTSMADCVKSCGKSHVACYNNNIHVKSLQKTYQYQRDCMYM